MSKPIQHLKTFPLDLSKCEKHFFSQNGEDGIIEAIFKAITPKDNYFVEIGTENGCECNTRYLREICGWKGLMIDGCHENPHINLQKEFVTAENINSLFAKYSVPHEFDLLSIDVDYNDFHLWKALDTRYQPRVVIIEYNALHAPNEDKITPYHANTGWDLTNYFGGSILAFFRLGQHKGYSLVCADNRGVNLFFIRKDVLEETNIEFLNRDQVDLIYRLPNYGLGPKQGHRQDILYRPYLSSHECGVN